MKWGFVILLSFISLFLMITFGVVYEENCATRIHAGRAAGRHRDHRRLDRSSSTGRSENPPVRCAPEVREQPETNRDRLAQLSRRLWKFSVRPHNGDCQSDRPELAGHFIIAGKVLRQLGGPHPPLSR